MDRIFNLLCGKFAGRPAPWFLLAALAFLYLHLFLWPDTPIWMGGDQSVFIVHAAQMLEGQLIYRDFFQFIFPGTESLYLALFKLFGPRVWVPSALLLLLGFGLTWLSLVISRKVLSGRAVFLPGLLFLTCSFRYALDGHHRWLSVLSATAAIAILLEKRSPVRLLGAGALCGLAAWFMQSRGLMAVSGLAVFLVWECRSRGQSLREFRKGAVCLFAPFLVTVVAANSYFVWKVGLAQFLHCTILFVARYYRSMVPWNTWKAYLADVPEFWPWYRLPNLGVWLFIHALIPLVYVVFSLRYRREARARPCRRSPGAAPRLFARALPCGENVRQLRAGLGKKQIDGRSKKP